MNALALLAPAVLAFGTSSPELVEAGQPCPEIVFASVVQGDGRTRLSEYRGQPVLLSLYSAVFGGIEGARGAVKLYEEYGPEGMALLLMEHDEHDETYLEALVMKHLPGTDCPLLRRQRLPFRWDKSTGPPPVMALVGIDGVVLYSGSYQGLGRIEDLVEAELERARDGWGESEPAREARALAFGRGQLGAARVLFDGVDDEAGGETSLALAEVEARFASWKRSVEHLRTTGRPTEARAAAQALVAAVEGHAGWSAEAAELLAAQETAEAEAWRKLEKQLARILEPLAKRSPKKGLDRKLERFAEKAGENPVATRARRTAEVVRFAVEEL